MNRSNAPSNAGRSEAWPADADPEPSGRGTVWTLKIEEPFFIARSLSDQADPRTGVAEDSYTVPIGEPNAAMQVHDRMPAFAITFNPRHQGC